MKINSTVNGLSERKFSQANPTQVRTTDQPSNALSLTAPKAGFPDFKGARQSVSSGGFLTAEKRLLSAFGSVTIDAVTHLNAELAVLYSAHGYYHEALHYIDDAVSKAGKETTLQASLAGLRLLILYKMGRFQDVVDEEFLPDMHFASPLRVMALSQLGRYDEANAFLESLGEIPSVLPSIKDEFYVQIATVSLALGLLDEARAALGRIEPTSASQNVQLTERYLQGQINFQELLILETDDKQRERDALSQLVKLPMPYGGLAAIERVNYDVKSGLLSLKEARQKLEIIGLTWHGGIFERHLRFATAELAQAEGDMVTAFREYRDLISLAPDTAYAKMAYDQLQIMMAALFANDDETAVLVATRLFYDNVDLLAPGRAGDMQIRNVTEKLVTLDLLDEAGELLEHQVFKRLRGVERSLVGVDLANIYLSDHKPEEALRVIRSTRITGLSEELRTERRFIEASGLWKTGQHGRALARLDLAGDQTLNEETIYLRAMIELDMGNFKAGGQTLFDLVVENLKNGDPLMKRDEEIVLKAVSAYVRSEDVARLETVRSLMMENYSEHPVSKVVSVLSGDTDPDMFFVAYRNWLVTNGHPDNTQLGF